MINRFIDNKEKQSVILQRYFLVLTLCNSAASVGLYTYCVTHCRLCILVDVKGKGRYSSSCELHLRTTGHHLSYGITQCYVPPDTSERARLTPAMQVGTRFYLAQRFRTECARNAHTCPCQVSRMWRESHSFEVYLTLSRRQLKSHAFTPHLKFYFFCRRK